METEYKVLVVSVVVVLLIVAFGVGIIRIPNVTVFSIPLPKISKTERYD